MTDTHTVTTDDEIVQDFLAYTDSARAYPNADSIWQAHGTVALVGPDVTEIGPTDLTTYAAATYVGTESITVTDSGETTRCYGFRTDGQDDPDWCNVEYVRELANDLLDVDYATLREKAHTTPLANCRIEGVAPVMFPVPDSEYELLVFPVIPSEEP